MKTFFLAILVALVAVLFYYPSFVWIPNSQDMEKLGLIPDTESQQQNIEEQPQQGTNQSTCSSAVAIVI